ncbi:MAG: hypothetical protein ABI347_02455 [Nitrososphaera sp.]
MVIIVSESGERARRIDKTELGNENYLQEYIKKNPDTILSEIKNEIKTLAFREFPTRVTGSIDLLALDRDGDIYVIETKLDRNTTKREVIAQALDYSAALWYHYAEEEFLGEIQQLTEQEFKVSFEDKVLSFFSFTVEEISAFTEQIKSNLRNGNFKIVVLMDRLDDRLKEMINFMNQKSKFTIYSIEVEQYKVNQLEIIIPKSFGTEVKKEVSVFSARNVWDEESYFEQAKVKLAPEQLRAVEKLVYKINESATLFTVNSEGQLQISIEHTKGTTRQIYINGLSKLREFASMINPNQHYYYRKIEVWSPATEAFIAVIRSLIRNS